MKRYDPEIDPYSSGCSPYAVMEDDRDGEYLSRWDLMERLKDIVSSRSVRKEVISLLEELS